MLLPGQNFVKLNITYFQIALLQTFDEKIFRLQTLIVDEGTILFGYFLQCGFSFLLSSCSFL